MTINSINRYGYRTKGIEKLGGDLGLILRSDELDDLRELLSRDSELDELGVGGGEVGEELGLVLRVTKNSSDSSVSFVESVREWKLTA